MMHVRLPLSMIAAVLIVPGCSQGSRQADQLDNAANQADPSAAAVMRNEADRMRENGSDADLSAPGSPVQSAMQNAGDAASNDRGPARDARATAQPLSSPTRAKPHRARDPVPPPQTR